MANNHSDTERRLWDAADEFRANSDLKSSEKGTTYAQVTLPVLRAVKVLVPKRTEQDRVWEWASRRIRRPQRRTISFQR